MQKYLSFYIKGLSRFPRFRGFVIGIICLFGLGNGLYMAETRADSASETSAQATIIYSIHPLTLIGREVIAAKAKHITLLPPGATPHDYALKISDIKKLKQADIIVWMGPEIEPYLAKAISKIAAEEKAISIDVSNAAKLPGIKLRAAIAMTPTLDEHHHDDAHHNEKTQQKYDPHLWLSPVNANIIAETLAKAFTGLKLEHEAYVSEKLQSFSKKIQAMKNQAGHESRQKIYYEPYVVYHDAFSYLENYLGIQNSGAITDHLHNKPGMRHAVDMIETIKITNTACLITPLNYDKKLTEKIVGSSKLNVITLDILAEQVAEGGFYTDYLDSLMRNMKACISYKKI
ncbi:MAG TPA: zinc ABC transporter substrate-binding protein [Pseudomonadales bacterium]